MTQSEPVNAASPEPAGLPLDPAWRAEPLLIAALALGEGAALWQRLAAGGRSLLDLAGIHLFTLAALSGLILIARRYRRDTTYALLALMGGIAMGPVGLLGAAFVALARRRAAPPSPLIAQWYDRIALSTTVPSAERLYDDVSVGRTLDLDARPPVSYPDAMSFGSLAERQAILGHIARHFHPAYLATLKIALASPEPLIRVQAAAVAAHIAPKAREHFLHRAAEAGRGPADPLRALALLGDLEDLARSGLLDETERMGSERLAGELGDRVAAGLDRGLLRLSYQTDVAMAAELDAHLERLLIARGRFADLRAHRTAKRLSRRHPRARLRRLAVPTRVPEAAE